MPKLSRNSEQLSRRIESAADSLAESPVVRLCKEDRVGRWFLAGTAAQAATSSRTRGSSRPIANHSVAAVTWIRLRRLPPPREPDPDDWL